MRHRARLSLLALACLAACSPPSLYHKPGGNVGALDRDLTACRAAAAREVPQAIRTRTIAPDTMLRPVCLPNGHCYWDSVTLRPAQIETYDANTDLRAEVIRLCMADKGYALIDLPACGPSAAERPAIRPDSPLPALSDRSCALRTNAGRWRVVTPGP